MIKNRIPNHYLLLFSWIVAIIATGGSLFFSQIMHLVPCTLCWYQRILMYPLVISLGIAYLMNDFSFKKYILPVSCLGFILACYHYIIQMLPLFNAVRFCSPSNPCAVKDFSIFGFITIPFMSAVAFLLITLIMMLVKSYSEERKASGSEPQISLRG
ncbi:disulfide oxidoreductase [Sporolactobacillus laevolacticus]|uniref:disulfide oxidoreductase n=1 Tax=Sporolactobacillus laevolacticus TaxID=33018 RepID=UPI0025B2B3E6|nr:disulfide oxidoreductase [Sporolactobacillus laevolacticus]MDN3954974.1 disulfide oxidoreductase [Sporolactobacillus laevolacticus]